MFFTPDGSKVLASLMIAERRSLVYFDANDGVLKGNGISAYNCCPYLKTKDALTMNSDGSLIIFITNRAGNERVSIIGVTFISDAFLSTGAYIWKPNASTALDS